MKHVRDETLVSNLKKKEREVGMRGLIGTLLSFAFFI